MGRRRGRVVTKAPGKSVFIERATKAHAAGLAALFERNEIPCYCRYYHFPDDRHAWLSRCASGVEENRREMLAALDLQSPEMSGVVATNEDGNLVGWLKLAPKVVMSKLYDQRLYRGLPTLSSRSEDIYTIGCFVVDQGFRRRGLSRRLLRGAVRLARDLGARAVEAFPHRPDGTVADSLLWTGPASIFEEAGFERIHDLKAYPVFRLELVAPGRGLD